jgi:hypothetical protein
MISENILKLLQSVTRIMRKSPQQRGLSSNYKATAKKLSISLIGGVMVALGTSTAAQAATFVSTNDGKIGKIDPTTGAFTQVASGNVAFTDIAISDSGKLYGINFSELFEVDLNTGTYSSIGFFGGAIDGDMNALTFGANNTLYGAKGDRIYSFNLQTGAATPMLPTPGFSSSGDLVFDAANNRLLATSKGGMNGSDRLYSIDLTNSTYLVLGDLGFKDVFGLTFENGNLMGYTSDRQQISIDSTTGKGTLLRDVTGTNSEIWGATYQPSSNNGGNDPGKKVPEPSTILGLLAVAAIRVISRLKQTQDSAVEL